MKLNRQIGILSVLLQKETTTAPELAERFEVSRRTINRDIEDLCMAGIPIVTTQGVGGGIRIMDGFTMDRTLFNAKEMQMIMAGLRSLDSISGSQYCNHLMEKIKIGSSQFVSGTDTMLIDLSTWYKDSITQKIGIIQDAIELKKMIKFWYYTSKEEVEREMEPYYLIFKWTNWYVYGYCNLRNDYRLFKLTRMEDIRHTCDFVGRKNVPLPNLDQEVIFQEKNHVRAIFEPRMKWVLVEQFGIHSFTEQPDGRLLLEYEYNGLENLIEWLLSCGDGVTVLEPEHVRKTIYRIASNLVKRYEEGEKCQDQETRRS